MELNEVKSVIIPIETLARPVESDYTLNAVDGKMEILFKLSREVAPNGVIVEIGSLFGATAVLMGLVTDDTIKIHCVELNVKQELRTHIKMFGLSEKIVILEGDSHDIGKSWTLPIDLLFIDGNHSYDGVISDSRIWTPSVKKGGVVVWHDYYNKLLDTGCGRAIDDFLEESEDFEVTMPETKEKIIRVARKL